MSEPKKAEDIELVPFPMRKVEHGPLIKEWEASHAQDMSAKSETIEVGPCLSCGAASGGSQKYSSEDIPVKVAILEMRYSCPNCGSTALDFGPKELNPPQYVDCLDCGIHGVMQDGWAAYHDPTVTFQEPPRAATMAQAGGYAAGPNRNDNYYLAPAFLHRAAGKIEERGKEYDKPDGERSVDQAVRAFTAITGIELTEAQGWMFLLIIKLVRSEHAAGFHQDSYEDAVAYSALMAEGAKRDDDEVLF